MPQRSGHSDYLFLSRAPLIHDPVTFERRRPKHSITVSTAQITDQVAFERREG
jgi:hypothetical protein